jgi:hypothetical protein
VRRSCDQEDQQRTLEWPDPLTFTLAKLPPDMNRVIVEFKLGVVVQR